MGASPCPTNPWFMLFHSIINCQIHCAHTHGDTHCYCAQMHSDANCQTSRSRHQHGSHSLRAATKPESLMPPLMSHLRPAPLLHLIAKRNVSDPILRAHSAAQTHNPWFLLSITNLSIHFNVRLLGIFGLALLEGNACEDFGRRQAPPSQRRTFWDPICTERELALYRTRRTSEQILLFQAPIHPSALGTDLELHKLSPCRPGNYNLSRKQLVSLRQPSSTLSAVDSTFCIQIVRLNNCDCHCRYHTSTTSARSCLLKVPSKFVHRSQILVR